MSEDIQQKFTLDASQAINQFNQLVVKAANLAGNLLEVNKAVSAAIKQAKASYDANNKELASYSALAKKVYNYRESLHLLTNTGKELQATFSRKLAANTGLNSAEIRAFSSEMAYLGQISQLSARKVKEVFKAVLTGQAVKGSEKTTELAIGLKRLFSMTKEAAEVRAAIKETQSLSAALKDSAKSAKEKWEAINQLVQKQQELDIISKGLSKKEKESKDSARIKALLLYQVKEAITKVREEQKKLLKDIVDSGKASEVYSQAVKENYNKQTSALQRYLNLLKQKKDLEARDKKDARMATYLEGILKKNFGFTGKFDTRQQAEIYRITDALVKLRKESGMSAAEFNRAMLNMANNTGHLNREQSKVGRSTVALTNAFHRVVQSAQRASVSTFEVGSEIRKLVLQVNSFNGTASAALEKKLLSIADATGKLAERSKMTKSEFIALMKAVQSGDWSAKVIKDNENIARSYYSIALQLKALKKARKDEVEATLRGNEAISSFRGLFPAETANPAFAKETEKIEQNLYKLAAASKVPKEAIKEIFSAAKVGILKNYSAEIARLTQIIKTGTPEQIKAAQAALQAAKAKEFLSIKAKQAIDQYKKLIAAKKLWAVEALKSIHLVNVSWSSYIRYFITRTAYRGFMLLVSGMREGVNQAFELQRRISEIRTISQDSSKTTASWSRELRALSDIFPQSTLDIAEGAYQSLSNQVANAGNVVQFLREALTLALTTLSTTAQSVNALSSVINAYNMSAVQARNVSAQLFKIVELGRVRLEDIAETLGNVTVLAAQLGISFEEVGASLTVLTRQGVTPSTAMTLLRNVIMKLIGPTENMKELFAEWGVNSAQAAIDTFGFFGVLQKLSVATKGDLTEINDLFSRIRGTIGFAGLTGGDNLKKYQRDLQEITASMNAYNEATNRMFDNVAMRVKIEGQKLQNYFAVDLGTAFVRMLDKINTSFGGITNIVKQATQSLISLGDTAIKTVNLFMPLVKLLLKLAPIYLGIIVQAKILASVLGLLKSRAVTLIKDFTTAIRLGFSLSDSFKLIGVSISSLTLGITGLVVAIGSYLAISYKMERDALKNIRAEIKADAEARIQARRVIQQTAAELNKQQKAENDLTEAIRRQRQEATVSRKINLETIAGTKEAIKTIEKDWKETFNKLDKETEKGLLNDLANALESIKNKIKQINDIKFNFKFIEPIEGYIDTEAKLLATIEKYKAYQQRAIEAQQKAEKAALDKDYVTNLEDARKYREETISALQEAESISTEEYRKMLARAAELREELSKPAYSISDFDSRPKLRRELAEIEEKMPIYYAQSNSLRKQIISLTDQQLEIERKITKEIEARVKLEEARIEKAKAENEKISKLATSLLEFDPTNFAKAQDSYLQAASEIKEANRILLSRGENGLAAALQLNQLFQRVQESYKAGLENFALDTRDNVSKEIKEGIQAKINSLIAEIKEVDSNLAATGETIKKTLTDRLTELELIYKNTYVRNSWGMIDEEKTSERNYELKQAIDRSKTLLSKLKEYESVTGAIVVGPEQHNKYAALLTQIGNVLAFSNRFSEVDEKIRLDTQQTRKEIADLIAIRQQSLAALEEATNKQQAFTEAISKNIQSISGFIKAVEETRIQELLGEEVLIRVSGIVEELKAVIKKQEQWNGIVKEQSPDAIKIGLLDPMTGVNSQLDSAIYRARTLIETLRSTRQQINDANNAPTEKKALGGWVRGSGIKDTVPAMLTPGEFVVNRVSAARFAPLLEAINSKRIVQKSSTVNNSPINITINSSGVSNGAISQEAARQIADIVRNDIQRGRIRTFA